MAAAERGKKYALKLLGAGATMGIGQEILCLMYAGFRKNVLSQFEFLNFVPIEFLIVTT